MTKRLIEVAFPIEEASLASVHEKNVRHGHLSTLHIWPARRPLAASRAAILAALLPDPGRADYRRKLLELIGGTETNDYRDGALFWGTENGKTLEDLRQRIKKVYPDGAPKLLDPFAGGGAIPLEGMRLGCEVTASDLNPVAWFILKCTLELPQKFAESKWDLPSFCKKWPDFVEDFNIGKVKKRKRSATAEMAESEQTEMLFSEFDAKQPADLAWHVRAWGRWVLERARADLDRHYPVINGEQPVAYLWARTARDPSNNAQIPLLKTFWFNKRKGHRSALLPVPKSDNSRVTFKLLEEDDFSSKARRQKIIKNHPFLTDWEVTEDTLDKFLQEGTMNRSGVWSPCGGRPGLICLDMGQLRRQGELQLLGCQMTVAVVEAYKPGSKQTFKKYREVTDTDLKAADIDRDELESLFQDIPFGIPNEPLHTGGGSGAGRAFSIPKYGFKTWGSLFSPRQLLALGTFVKHTREAREAARSVGFSDEYVEAISCYLAIGVNRVADYNSSVCSWHVGGQKMRNTFGRFALPIVWDYAECPPISVTSGGYPGTLEWITRYIEHALKAANSSKAKHPEIVQISAKKKHSNNLDIIVTDPPYYDSIPYSDLMDFFYVWLRRTLWALSPEFNDKFAEPLAPKWNHEDNDGELIDDESRFEGNRSKSKKNYEDGMRDSFKTSFESLKNDGLLVIVFANKETDAWETLIRGIIRAGGEVTASWPIRTEMINRARGLSSAALSSSVWIVCRKRKADAGTGFDAQVLKEMRSILMDPRKELDDRNLLQFYFQSGIHGPDFIWAALGPALQAYSRYQLVRKTEGGVMSVTDFLQEVRHIVMQFSLGELPGFRETHTAKNGKGADLNLDPVTQYYLLHRGFFGMAPAPSGACILYANACGKSDRELQGTYHVIKQAAKEGGDSGGNQYQLLPWKDRIELARFGESRNEEPAPLIDRVHKLMHLLKENKGVELRETFDRWGLKGEPALRPLLFALRHLANKCGDKDEERILDVLTDQFFQGSRMVAEEGGPNQYRFGGEEFEEH